MIREGEPRQECHRDASPAHALVRVSSEASPAIRHPTSDTTQGTHRPPSHTPPATPPPPCHRRRPACSARLALGVIVHEYVEHYHRERNHQVWLATRGSALKPSRRDAFTGSDPARRRRRGHDRRVDDGRDRRQGAARRQSRRRGRGEIMGQTEQDSGKTYADMCAFR